MNNPETQKEYTTKYDKLESIILSDSNDKNAYDKLLLYLILENHKNEIESQDIERCYQIIKKSK